MLAKIYSDELLAAAGKMPRASRLEAPDASATRVSRVCGSEVTVDLCLTDEVVSAFAIEAKACALGQAACGLLAESIMGAGVEELRILREEVFAMLKENGPPPSGNRWTDMAKLQPIRDYPARHASTLLVFDAVVACLDQIAVRGEDG